MHLRVLLAIFVLYAGVMTLHAAADQMSLGPFLEEHCFDCHDADTKKGSLRLDDLSPNLANRKNFATWEKVFDKVASGEMPPKKEKQPEPLEVAAFTKKLGASLVAAERAELGPEGRTTQRRLNRYEYENALRDLLHAPWLQIKDALPEDGESHRFNKSGEALGVSHVQIARYIAVADDALRQVVNGEAEAPVCRTVRYYARDQSSFAGKMKYSVFNQSPERATFPLLGPEGQPRVRAGLEPVTVGAAEPELREQEAIGVVASTYEPLEIRFNEFKAPKTGRYKLRFSAYSVWVGPGKPEKWWTPNLDDVSDGRRSEPVTIYSETPPRLLRWLGAFDVYPEPLVQELDVWLLAGETIRPDAARLFRSRPPNWRNPLAEKDGQPGVAFRWMEVEGPISDESSSAGLRLLFGNLPVERTNNVGAAVEVISRSPEDDAKRLLRNFVEHAYRKPVSDEEALRFLPVIQGALQTGVGFADAMIAGYTAVLCSPQFVCLNERPGRLDDFALAARLSFFLLNSPPDEELRAAAASGELLKQNVLKSQTERLLSDPKSRRFVDAFLDYWLDLRKMTATAPDSTLYPDYYLDDLLIESARTETRRFFAELLGHNLPARNIVSSDFAMLNERLAAHYGLPHVEGVELRRVELPEGSPRGGFMTQASVLEVTANGTTTSPVLRGAWIMERILGKAPPPPPASVPAVEPDIRGATTIREQLDKHRTSATCAACHANIDPAGFALENFDVMGGWRNRYRAEDKGPSDPGIGHNGQKFTFHAALAVDSSGELPGGGKFGDVRELKKLLLLDEKQIARNFVRQLVVYATGAPVRFSDREEIERILQNAAGDRYGVRTLAHEVVQSELFRNK